MKLLLFQYAVIWHPTEKQIKEESLQSKVLVDVTTVLAGSLDQVRMQAAMEIPADYKAQLGQIDIGVRPF